MDWEGVLVHVSEQIVSTEWFDESIDTRTFIRRNHGTSGSSCCRIWRGDGIVLTAVISN
jgi:hypothetical protein